MSYNPRLEQLNAYPFERLRELTQDIPQNTASQHIALSIGEPKHPPPDFVVQALSDADLIREKLAQYPATRGSDELRAAITSWLERRYGTTLNSDTQVLPVNGTREALFAFAQAMLSGQSDTLVLMPNPFYQIYEGAALLAGATPYFVNNQLNLSYQQDFDAIPEAVWQRAELIYLCSPGNPTGQVIAESTWQHLIELAHRHNFILAADECYSEIYFERPPGGLLSASERMGNHGHARCVVFHSLSKRSNLPGLRSGFVAGDAKLMTQFLRYRTYHGCALGAHHQHVSTLAWQDEAHVAENRRLYREKFAAVSKILSAHYTIHQPEGGFYHWLPTPMDDQRFCHELLASQNVTVMPGSFLARHTDSGNPGENHVRVAWVAGVDDCITAANRLATFAQML